MAIFYLVAGIALLILGGEYLVKSSVGISLKFNLSRIVIGMTVVSFATSLPELLVSINAALQGHPDLALSNVVGSNIANIAMVLGATAILTPIFIKKVSYIFNIPVMIFISLLLYWFLKNDLILSFAEGAILFILLIIFIIALIKRSSTSDSVDLEEIDEDVEHSSNFKILLWLIIGGAALWGGSELLVKGAVELAKALGVSERIIGVSIVAIGTSIPELAASVISALKKEKDLSLGNLIGSNIFNIGSVLGITAMIKPIHVLDVKLINNDILWMLATAILLIPLALLPKRNEISWKKGTLYIIFYISYIYLVVRA